MCNCGVNTILTCEGTIVISCSFHSPQSEISHESESDSDENRKTCISDQINIVCNWIQKLRIYLHPTNLILSTTEGQIETDVKGPQQGQNSLNCYCIHFYWCRTKQWHVPIKMDKENLVYDVYRLTLLSHSVPDVTDRTHEA